MSSLGRIRSAELLLGLKDAILCEPVFSFPTCVALSVSSVVIDPHYISGNFQRAKWQGTITAFIYTYI